MEETLVFIDEGFLDKVTILLGSGKRLKFNKLVFAERLAQKQALNCKRVFYYTCPPFQAYNPSQEEIRRRKGYDRFINALAKNERVTIRQGRCQRITDKEGKVTYHQKGVDILLTIDLSHLREDFPLVKKIILVSSDTDFCPIISDIQKRWGIEVILYSFFERKRGSKFSLSNELVKCCSRYYKLVKEDFETTFSDKIKDGSPA